MTVLETSEEVAQVWKSLLLNHKGKESSVYGHFHKREKLKSYKQFE